VDGLLVEHLGEDEAVLVIDESGDLKQGTNTVGVQRQYTGTAGRVENAQVMVLLVYASSNGHGIIDRELHLPRSWTDDLQRCRAAGVPDEVGFATKPELAKVMLGRALDAGVPAGWVTGDEVYGASSKLRGELEARQIGYVGGRLPPPGPLRWRHLPGRRAAHQGACQGVAVCAGRQGRQGRALLRLGLCASGPRRSRSSRSGGAALAHGPPQP
jgi:hypothetical protein